MKDSLPIYNSRIQKIYLEYLRKYYPNVDIASVLEYAGITKYEVEDPAHWFSQKQADRLHDVLVTRTDNPNIAREAGRYTASSGGLGPVKQYVMGLFSLASLYLMVEKSHGIFSRGATLKAKKLGANKVEFIATPKPGINEKPYQCENRIGTFESLPKLFTEKFGKIEHPTCFHKGDEYCRYIITWDKTPALIWKRIRNYAFLLSILGSFALFFVQPVEDFTINVLLFAVLDVMLLAYSEHLDKKELAKTIETQGNAAKDHLNEMNIRYNNALLVQEIGQATSTVLDIDKLFSSVVNVMEKRLDFDRGMIMLADKERTKLLYTAGYGYTSEQENLLQQIEFHLDKPGAEGIFVVAFKTQKPFLVNDIAEIGNNFSK
jgi:hypothetical protein